MEVWELGNIEVIGLSGCPVVGLSTDRVQFLEKQENRSMGAGGYGS